MTVLPDGHSIIFTTQAGNYVQSVLIRGNFYGDLFEGSTQGRMNFLLYNYSATYKIRFVRDEARIEDVFTPNGVIPNGHHTVRIFHKVRS